MTRGEIKAAIRKWLVDEVGEDADRYWDDDELNEYIQDAANVFCRLTKIIRDSLTDSVCLLTVQAGSQHVKLSSLIILSAGIERAKPSWSTEPLTLTTLDEITKDQPTWEDDEGDPDCYLLNYSSGYLSLNRKLQTDGTIRLTGRRMPLRTMSDDEDEPEFNPLYHSMLYDYILYRAFSKQESEIYNPQKAEKHLILFQGTDELRPGGHIGRVLMEISEPLPNIRHAQFF